MLKKKKTTASGKLVLVKSVRRTRSRRMKFCVQGGLGALPSTSKAEGKITAGFFPLRAECINTGIACQSYPGMFNRTQICGLVTDKMIRYDKMVNILYWNKTFPFFILGHFCNISHYTKR